MATEKLRVGLIGANIDYGWGGRAHVPALQALPEYELTAVCTAHPETARAAADKFGVRLAFHDYGEMLAHPDIDVVVVAVRVPKHYDIVMDVLQAGKPVYTEWPLAASLSQAQEVADLASAKGLPTMVGLQLRAAPGFRFLKELVEGGYVGEVLACHLTHFSRGQFAQPADRMYHADKNQGVNTLTVIFGHMVDVFCDCLGEFRELSSVVSTQVKQWQESDTGRTVDVTSPDNILVSGTLENGAVASIHVGAVPGGSSGLRIEVYGREGVLVATMPQNRHEGQPTIQGSRGQVQELEALPIPGYLNKVPDLVSQGPAVNVAHMYRRFAEAVRDGRRVEPDFQTGLQRMRLLGTIGRASETGQRQQVGKQ